MQDMRSREKRIKGDKNVKFTPILSQKQQDEQKNRSLETVNNNINVTNTFFRRPFRNCNRF